MPQIHVMPVTNVQINVHAKIKMIAVSAVLKSIMITIVQDAVPNQIIKRKSTSKIEFTIK